MSNQEAYLNNKNFINSTAKTSLIQVHCGSWEFLRADGYPYRHNSRIILEQTK